MRVISAWIYCRAFSSHVPALCIISYAHTEIYIYRVVYVDETTLKYLPEGLLTFSSSDIGSLFGESLFDASCFFKLLTVDSSKAPTLALARIVTTLPQLHVNSGREKHISRKSIPSHLSASLDLHLIATDSVFT